MGYRITVEPAATRAMHRLAPDVRQRIANAINALANEPRPPGVRKLRAQKASRYRLRVGDYRVLYEINDRVLHVVIVKVGNRRDVYRE